MAVLEQESILYIKSVSRRFIYYFRVLPIGVTSSANFSLEGTVNKNDFYIVFFYYSRNDKGVGFGFHVTFIVFLIET